MLQRTQSQQSCSSLSSFINARFTFNATSSEICQRLEDFIKEYMKQFGKIRGQGQRLGECSEIKQKLGDIQKNGNNDSLESFEVNGGCNLFVKYVCQLLMALNKSQEHEEYMSQISQKQKEKLKDFINVILQKLRLELQIQAIENGKQNQGEIFKQIINKIIIQKHRKMNIFEEVLLENGYINEEEYTDIAQKYGFDKTKKKQQQNNHIEKNTKNNDKNNYLLTYFQRNIGKFDQLLVDNEKTLKNQELNSMMPLKQKQIQKSRTIYHSRKSVHMVKKSSSSRQYFSSYGTHNSFDKLESFDNSTQWSSTQNSQNYDSLNSKGKNKSYFKSKSSKNFNEIQMEIENRQREEDQSFLVAVTPKLRPSFSKIDFSREKRINFVLQF